MATDSQDRHYCQNVPQPFETIATYPTAPRETTLRHPVVVRPLGDHMPVERLSGNPKFFAEIRRPWFPVAPYWPSPERNGGRERASSSAASPR